MLDGRTVMCVDANVVFAFVMGMLHYLYAVP
jgi:hypothetical protein